MAGTPSSKEMIPPPPPPEPASLWQWFAGASAGYLFDTEEPMYHIHLGVEFPSSSAWKSALFLELGWMETDLATPFPRGLFPNAGPGVTNSDLEVMPLTLNYKIERQITGGLSFYAGAGAGIAFIDSSTYTSFAFAPAIYGDDSDEVFVAQVFAGLVYNVTEAFEIYGGARWIYLDEPSFATVPGVQLASFEDDVLGELGFRVNF